MAKPSSMLSYKVLKYGETPLTAKSATFQDIAGSFPKRKPRKPVSVEDMKKAVSTRAATRFRKAR
jgi:hypothetical protein